MATPDGKKPKEEEEEVIDSGGHVSDLVLARNCCLT